MRPAKRIIYEARPAAWRAEPVAGAFIAICTLGLGYWLMRRRTRRLVIAEGAVYFHRGRERLRVAAERIRTYRVKRSRLELLLGTCTLVLYGPGGPESVSAAPQMRVAGLTDVDGVRTAMEALMHVYTDGRRA